MPTITQSVMPILLKSQYDINDWEFGYYAAPPLTPFDISKVLNWQNDPVFRGLANGTYYAVARLRGRPTVYDFKFEIIACDVDTCVLAITAVKKTHNTSLKVVLSGNAATATVLNQEPNASYQIGTSATKNPSDVTDWSNVMARNIPAGYTFFFLKKGSNVLPVWLSKRYVDACILAITSIKKAYNTFFTISVSGNLVIATLHNDNPTKTYRIGIGSSNNPQDASLSVGLTADLNNGINYIFVKEYGSDFLPFYYAKKHSLVSNNLPTITAQPTAQSFSLGGSVNLSVTAQNYTSISWFKEGNSTAIGTGANLNLTNATANTAGRYYCKVSGAGVTIESNRVFVTLSQNVVQNVWIQDYNGTPWLNDDRSIGEKKFGLTYNAINNSITDTYRAYNPNNDWQVSFRIDNDEWHDGVIDNYVLPNFLKGRVISVEKRFYGRVFPEMYGFKESYQGFIFIPK